MSFAEYLTRDSKESGREMNLCIVCVSEEIDFKKIGRQLGSDRTQICQDQINFDIDKFGEEKLYLLFERNKEKDYSV